MTLTLICCDGERCNPENLLLGLVHQKLCMTTCPVKHLDSDSVDFRAMNTAQELTSKASVSTDFNIPWLIRGATAGLPSNSDTFGIPS